MTVRDARKPRKGADERAARESAALAAIGLEAEFAIVVDGQSAKPEDVFESPTRIVRGRMMHRTGRSYHLPTGGAMYFDTGVIEIATPVIEIDRGCSARAGRSLWESIRFLRQELDAWEVREGRTVQLSGFSTHYNVSFDLPHHERGESRSVEKLALLLTHLLAMPVMLLAANRRSTGIGVRPRVNRIEVTADFTPDAALMIAAATFLVGAVRVVMKWPACEIEELASQGIRLEKTSHDREKGGSLDSRRLLRTRSYRTSPRRSGLHETATSFRCARSRRGSLAISGRRSRDLEIRDRCA